MDNRITKKRLSQLLSYDLWKIIALIVAGIFVWSLLFTTLGARLSEGQQLNIYAYNVKVTEQGQMDDLIDVEKDNGEYYSYEVYATRFYSLGDFSASNTTVSQQITAWSSVGQLDVMFISDTGKEIKSTDKDGKETFASLFDRYSYYFYDLDKLVTDAISYCKLNGNMTDDGTFDEDAIINFFNVRKKSDNFYRHGMIKAEQEIDRFEKIRDNAFTLRAWLNNPELSSIWKISEFENGDEKVTMKTGIKLDDLDALCGSNPTTGKKLANLCTMGGTSETGEGATVGKVVLSVFNNSSYQADLVYESLAFLVKTVKTYTSL
ncbi:MAG: hypothetical protein MRZ91_05175 [Christensenellaceae bacterium]|nr:hypothetical protein [Christensenellaceae bacterium]MDD6927236.1 hypothetical protein [bacterium]MDY2851493.1 hypothetical protein [Christensenellaceae bacterium]